MSEYRSLTNFTASSKRAIVVWLLSNLVLFGAILITTLLVHMGIVAHGTDLAIVAGLFVGVALGIDITFVLLKTETVSA